MIQFTKERVRALAGNPLTVLVLLMIDRQPMGKGAICMWTGFSDKTVSTAVRLLVEMGLVTENGRYIYQIAAGVQQLPLMANELPADTSAIDDERDEANVFDVDPELGRNISDLNDHACMHDSESLTIDSINENPACMHETDDGNSDLDAELIEAGFREPGLGRLRKQPGLTARVVRYHVQHAPSLGAALTRIEKHWKVPQDFEPEGLEAGSERKKRYGGGRFAEIVQT